MDIHYSKWLAIFYNYVFKNGNIIQVADPWHKTQTVLAWLEFVFSMHLCLIDRYKL